MEVFNKIFSSLNKAQVKYMVVGGIAVNLYGIERATADIDILLEMTQDNLGKFTGVARELGLKPKIPVTIEDFLNPDKRREWLTEKELKVFSLYDPQNPFFLLDVLIDTPFDFDEVHGRRNHVEFQGMAIPVVSLDDLIRMKEATNRPQDTADLHYLKKIREAWEREE